LNNIGESVTWSREVNRAEADRVSFSRVLAGKSLFGSLLREDIN